MTEHEMKELVVRQRTYFETGATLPVTLRITALRKLYSAISANENAIHDALKRILEKVDLKVICVKPDLFSKKSVTC